MAGLLVCAIKDRQDAAPALVAEVLAGALDAGVLLLHVADAPPGTMPGLPDPGRPRRAAMTGTLLAHGAELLEEISSRCGLDSAERRVAAGRTVEQVVKVADQRAATLIIVGGGHPGAVRRALRGTLAQKLVPEVWCPVIVAPLTLGERPDWPRVSQEAASQRSVLCGVDDSYVGQGAVTLAADLAEGLGARVLLAHVLAPGADAAVATQGSVAMDVEALHGPEKRDGLRVLERALLGLPARVPAELRLLKGEVAQQLSSLAASEGSDFIVVGSRGMGPLRSALLGSTSAKLASQAPVPVAMFPPEASSPHIWPGDECPSTA